MHRQANMKRLIWGGVYAAGMLAVAGLLAGCSQTCSEAGVVGKFTMRSGSDTYDLQLANDGTGALARNGHQMESLTWEWANEQVFLHVSRATIDQLMAPAGRETPAGVANFRAGYFGLDPQCRLGSSKAWALGVYDSVAFSRGE